MNNAQAYAAYAPVHLCPGNHESANDFFQYINRFNMMPPSANATGDGSYHSFNVGLTHVIMFSSEVCAAPECIMSGAMHDTSQPTRVLQLRPRYFV